MRFKALLLLRFHQGSLVIKCIFF